jgi:DNA-binding GntR family transcriptional regulator
MEPFRENKTAQRDVYEKIKLGILCRKYPENSYLVERKMAEELFVSRTPVRQAFKLLETEGWITYIRNRGMKVTILSEQEVHDIFEVRKPLEGLAAVTACQCIEWAELQQLKECIEEQTTAKNQKDWNLFIDVDLKFHNILLYTQKNKIMRQILLDLRGKSKLIGIRILYGDKGRLELTLNEHNKIYYAILRNHPEEAQQCMEEHIQSVYEAACDYLAVVRKTYLSNM